MKTQQFSPRFPTFYQIIGKCQQIKRKNGKNRLNNSELIADKAIFRKNHKWGLKKHH